MKRQDQEELGGWERLLGFFIDNKLIVFILVGLLALAGIVVLPFNVDEDGIGSTSVLGVKISDLPRDRVPVDAIPDIGENQQIVFTRWAGRSPRDIEDQISYPLTTSLLGIPGVRSIRSFSMFGFSSIYIIFEEGVEFYWSRSRILEKLNSLPPGTVPDGVTPMLGPDATALGQVFWYTLEARDTEGNPSSGFDLHELRSIQDFQVRYALQSIPGVSEVASVGGHVREYQVDVNPEALRAHDVSITHVAHAVKKSNLDVGARTMEINNIEYVIRGLGFIESIEDLEETVIVSRDHTPIRIRDVATVQLGPANRRGALDVGGAEAVGGVVVARYGENPMAVIERVQEKIAAFEGSLPSRTLSNGTVSKVSIVPFYDRSTLIQETLSTLSTALVQQILITIIVVLIMLRNLRSSMLISLLLPLGVLATFIAMKAFQVDANIMSLAGIAIAIGTMVDMGIVIVENIVEHLRKAHPDEPRGAVVRAATAEVGSAVLTSVLTTVVSFLPVFALTASEGKLFRPLAYTKTFALLAALLLSLFVIPALAHILLWRKAHTFEGEGSFFARLTRSMVRPAHLRDLVLVTVGVATAFLVNVWIGLFVALVGIMALLEPVLPTRVQGKTGWVENSVAVLAVVYLLTADWMPLGIDVEITTNLVFVTVIIAAVLGGFLAIVKVYDRLLAWTLRHKLLFLIAPTVVVVFGLTAWRGFDSMFGWLPSGVKISPTVSKVAHQLPALVASSCRHSTRASSSSCQPRCHTRRSAKHSTCSKRWTPRSCPFRKSTTPWASWAA